MNIHCEGCEKKVKKLLKEIDGVYSTKTDAKQGTVAVLGNVDPSLLINKLAKNNKPAVLLAQFDHSHDHGHDHANNVADEGGFKPNFDNQKKQKHHHSSYNDGDEEICKDVVTKSVTVMKKNRKENIHGTGLSGHHRRQQARWFDLGFIKDVFRPRSHHVHDDDTDIGHGGGGEQEIQITTEEEKKEDEDEVAKLSGDRVIVTEEEETKKKTHDDQVEFGRSKADVVIKLPETIQTTPTLQEVLVRTHAAKKKKKKKTPNLVGEEEQKLPIKSNIHPPVRPPVSATTAIPSPSYPSTQSYFSDDNTNSCHLM